MPVRVLFARTAEEDRRIGFEPEFGGIECGVLAREDEARRQAALRERARNRLQLDRFRPGADDQPYIGETQSSP